MASAEGKTVDPSPSTSGISFTSALTTDYREDMSEYEAFRTVITVPAGTAEVELWAEEPTTVTIRDEEYTIDASKGVVVAPNAMGKVIVTLEAEDVAASPLLLRTNAMARTERFYVFPDADAQRKLSQLSGDELDKNREALGISKEVSKEDCDNVAKTLQSLADVVQRGYDPATGGLGKYAKVPAEASEEEDWQTHASTDLPTYRRLTSAEAEAASKGATRIGGELGQGKKKKKKKKGLGKKLKKAGKKTKKATNKATKTTTKAASSATKTVSKTATSAGKAVSSAAKTSAKELRHGQLIDAADITQDMAKIAAMADDAAGEMAKVIRQGAKSKMAVAVKIGGKTLHWLVDTAEHVGKVIKEVVKQIGTTVKKLVKWLVDLLGWDDILHTQRVIKSSFNKALDFMAGTTQTAKKEVKALIGSLDKMINKSLDKAIDKYGGGMPSTKGKKSPIPSVVSDKVDWLLDHFSRGKDKDDEGDKSKGEELADESVDSITKLLREFITTVGDDPELKEALSGAVDQVVRMFETPNKVPELLLGVVLNLFKAMANLLTSLLEGVFSLAMDLLEKVIVLFRKLLNAKLKIPFLNKLFKMITKGEPLTLLNFITLLIAIPANLIGKTLGGVPFKKVGALGQELSDEEWLEAQHNYGWGVVYGAVQFVGMWFVPSDFKEEGSTWGDWNKVKITLSIIGQIAGFPTGHPSFDGWSWNTTGTTANTIWLYQWFMVAGSVVLAMTNPPTPAAEDEETSFGVAMEGVHLIGFIILVILIAESDSSQDDRLDAACILDPFPGLLGFVNLSAVRYPGLRTAAGSLVMIIKLSYASLYWAAITDAYQKAKLKRKRD